MRLLPALTSLLLAAVPLGATGAATAAEAGTAIPALANPAAGLHLPAERYQAVIGRPPAPGSPEALADLEILRRNERTRTPAGVLQSWGFLTRTPGAFSAAIGADVFKTAPTLAAGLPTFLALVDRVKDQLKDAVARPRPFLSHPELRPCLPLESGFSYPSGHATWFAAAGLLLADLLPQRRERLLETGLQGGSARTYCGVHYPSDVAASRKLAAAVTRDILSSPQWQEFRRQVEPELGKLLVVPPAGLPDLNPAADSAPRSDRP
jgi:acid phosphatase (class A)